MKTVQSQVKSGFVAFIKFAPGVFLLGIFLGVTMATVTVGWPRYLVSFLVFVIALALLVVHEKEKRRGRSGKKLRTQIDEEMQRMQRGASLGKIL